MQSSSKINISEQVPPRFGSKTHPHCWLLLSKSLLQTHCVTLGIFGVEYCEIVPEIRVSWLKLFTVKGKRFCNDRIINLPQDCCWCWEDCKALTIVTETAFWSVWERFASCLQMPQFHLYFSICTVLFVSLHLYSFICSIPFVSLHL